jgi:hypothetical protein
MYVRQSEVAAASKVANTRNIAYLLCRSVVVAMVRHGNIHVRCWQVGGGEDAMLLWGNTVVAMVRHGNMHVTRCMCPILKMVSRE